MIRQKLLLQASKEVHFLFVTLVLQTAGCALLAASIKSPVISNTVINESTPYSKTIGLNMILKLYIGKCHGFVTTIKYEKVGCYPVYKTNMICAGTCPSIVYPKDGGLKEFCHACQAKSLNLEKISFSCWKGRKEEFAWIRVAVGCQCSRVSCGLYAKENF